MFYTHAEEHRFTIDMGIEQEYADNAGMTW
jgi:hypothetical protein